LFHSNEDRLKEILAFVKHNPETIKSKVIDHMTKKNMGSLVITHSLLIKLIRSGKITVLNPNSRDHRLVINDKNEFNRLAAEIAILENTSNNLTFAIISDKSSREIITSKNTTSPSKRHLLNVIHFCQLALYGRITALVEEIEQNIRSQDDRQALYHLLPNLLLASDKLNRVILPQVESEVTEMTKQFREGITTKRSDMGNVIKEIIRIVAVSYFEH
jgi:hypothetical protein